MYTHMALPGTVCGRHRQELTPFCAMAYRDSDVSDGCVLKRTD